MTSKMSVNQLVVIVLCMIVLIFGIFLLIRMVLITEVLPESPGNVIANVNPLSSQKGTLFLITAVDTKQREQQDLSLIIEKNDFIGSVTLYDDGKHYDKNPNDGFYGGFFDSTDKPLGKYNIRDKDKILAYFEVSDSKCENIYGKGKIKFVILPFNYTNYTEFKEDAKKIIMEENSLLTIEPFVSNKDKFSFLIINTSYDLGCVLGCRNVSTMVCCDNEIVLKEASRCSYDSIFVLVRDEEECGSASSYAKVCSKNSYPNLILLHELGHSFADLADEYVYSDFFGDYSIGEVNDANCAEEGCEKWKNITDGCYKGCTYSNLYRSADKDSVMYDLYPQFNEVCKKHIETLIENYIIKQKEFEKTFPKKKSYFININYNNGKIKIRDVFLKPIRSEIGYRNSDYRIEIKDSKNNNIFNSSIYVPDKLYPLPNSGEIIFEKDFDFSLTLPYFSEADNMIIYRKEKPVASISLVAFSETCGNKICDGSENHLSCSSDCDIKDNFCETSACDPDCESQKNCSSLGKIKSVLPFFLISISLIILITLIVKIRRNFN